MSSVEQSIQLQIQDIAAVKQSFVDAVMERQPTTLWWLVDDSQNIIYENRVKGTSILAIDQNVTAVNIASIYSDWFSLQNAYFSQDQPIPGVSSLKQAIETYYRWRVSQYFNDIMSVSGGQGISPPYVFPYPDSNLFSYDGTTWTKGTGPVDLTVTGPGILGVIPVGADTTAADTLSITAVYPDSPGSPISTVILPSVAVPSASPAGVAVPVGRQALTAAYTLTDGVIAVASTLGFKVGAPVVIAENTPGSNLALPVIKFEVAEVAVMTGASLTLRQPTPSGATTPFPNGLRNQYTTAAFVYPLFKDVTAVTGGGTDELQIGFYPDYPQGFVDVVSIVVPQVMGQDLDTKEGTDSESSSPSPHPSLPPPPLHSRSPQPSLPPKSPVSPSSPKSPSSPSSPRHPPDH